MRTMALFRVTGVVHVILSMFAYRSANNLPSNPLCCYIWYEHNIQLLSIYFFGSSLRTRFTVCLILPMRKLISSEDSVSLV